jgi:uncharacterized protein (TIGR04222 family)
VSAVCLVLGTLLVVGAVAPRLWTRARETGLAISPVGVALLRGGDRAALVTAVVTLHRDGVVAAGSGGTLRRIGVASGGEPLVRAVYASLPRDLSLRDLLIRPSVRGALRDVRADLARRGLALSDAVRVETTLAGVVGVVLGILALVTAPPAAAPVAIVGACAVVAVLLALLSPRTLRGQRMMAALRARSTDEDVVMTIAVTGERALRAALPRFAADAGLLDTDPSTHDG